jgi:formylglycine-generating enzyme required for sulfatase activity
MHGGVYEWTADWYAPKWGPGPYTDPVGPARGREKAIRGGSWGVEGWECRSAYRRGVGPKTRGDNLGFRVVMELR